MLEPLSGRLTLLFTDIEGSTRLLHERGADYPTLLAHHREMVRAALTEHRGTEVDTQGDAFFAVFGRASDALETAETIQGDSLEGPMRVRIGMHTGAPLWTGEGYVGPDVHLAARICAAAHGGQVLLSEATRQLAGERRVKDLGPHRLKDIPGPTQLYQLGTEVFPPLRTMHATNLPVQPASLIGREREQAELAGLLADGGPRLMTLVGPGGIGKTTLATDVAAERVPLTPGGVFFVDLTRVRDADQVTGAIAQTIGATGDLSRHIGDKAMLLVLDNMEHVIAAATDVAQLRSTCPNLRLLVTSRIRLRVRGEREYPVDPLPDDASVALFLERAHPIDPSVTADEAVVEICRRLDGLPLAIELAASRLRVLSTTELLQRLDRRLALLTGGPRDVPDRQQTLQATVAWSADLLPPGPRGLLTRLAVFVGGWTLEAAESICGATLEDLDALIEHSLVQRTANRYGMLETIREFAADDLSRATDDDAIHERHARFYADACRTALADRGFEGAVYGFIDDDDFLAYARSEAPNLRAAFEWLEAHAEGEDVMVMVAALWVYWITIGATELGERSIQSALDLTDPADSARRAWFLALLGEFPRFTGDYHRAIRIKLEALDVARRVGDQGTPLAVLADLASLHAMVGEFDAGRRFGEEALRLRRAGAVQLGVAGQRGIAHAIHGLAEVAMKSGDPVEAERLLREADELEAASDTPSRDRIWTAMLIEEALRGQGRTEEAHNMACDNLARAIELEYPMMILESLVALSEIKSHTDMDLAATFLGAVEALREQVHLIPFDPDDHLRTIARVRSQLGDDAYQAATRRGRSLTSEELLALA